jgi:tripartite-type tricarboxylate transporter receptor subunit TctC
LPNLPTIGESVPGYESDGWFGFLAPAGTPKPIVDKLNAEINRALKQPKMLQTLNALGLIPVTESPEYFGQLMQREDQKFAKLVKDIGYQPQ